MKKKKTARLRDTDRQTCRGTHKEITFLPMYTHNIPYMPCTGHSGPHLNQQVTRTPHHRSHCHVPQTKLLFLSSSRLSSPCSKPLLCSPLLFSQPGPALSAPLTGFSLPTAVLLLLLFLNPTSSPLPVSMLPPSSSQASSIPYLPSSSLHLSFCSRGDMTSRASESQTYTKSYLQASEGCVHSEVQAPPP